MTNNEVKHYIKDGEYYVKLIVNHKKEAECRLAEIVAKHFIKNDNPKTKTEVDFKDGNKTNYGVKNLEWITKEEYRRRHPNTTLSFD